MTMEAVCGPNCFLITLNSRQDKIVSLEKHVRGIRVSLEEGRPGGNLEQGIMLQSSLPSWEGRAERGGRGRLRATQWNTNRTHLHGVGDSEKKCAISPRTSHHSLWNLI